MSTKVEGQSVSPNDAKPDVAGSPVSSPQDIALAKCLEALKGLSYKDAQDVLYNALAEAKRMATL